MDYLNDDENVKAMRETAQEIGLTNHLRAAARLLDELGSRRAVATSPHLASVLAVAQVHIAQALILLNDTDARPPESDARPPDPAEGNTRLDDPDPEPEDPPA